MQPSAERPITVLVVDDDPGIRALLECVLPRHGLTVLAAGGGAEAVELFRRERGRIDVALIDLHMPGLGGVETLRRLRAIAPELRCCLMSGDGGALPPDEAEALGVSFLAGKPFQSEELAGLLRDCVAAPPSRPGRRRSPRCVGACAAEVERVGRTGDLWAAVVDRSRGGMALALDAPAAEGETLRVRAAGRIDCPWAEVVVRHRRPHGDRWVVGCRFTAAPPESLLLALGAVARPL